jgi:hypothetical protein
MLVQHNLFITMKTETREANANRTTQQRIRVGIIGGMLERRATLLTSAQPLVAAGHTVAAIEGGWFTGESTNRKIERVQRFLDEWQPNVLYGPSAGGLLAVVAGFKHPSVERIVTSAAPLRWPTFRENTVKLRAIETAVPALRGLRDTYNEQVRDQLGSTTQRFLHFRGIEDEMVPPALSWMTGSQADMTHIEHEIFPTPPRQNRGSAWAHTLNTRGVFHLPKFQQFVAGDFAIAV